MRYPVSLPAIPTDDQNCVEKPDAEAIARRKRNLIRAVIDETRRSSTKLSEKITLSYLS